MAKKQEMVDYLIENEEFSGWTEDDRAGLEEMEEGGLTRLVALADRTQELIENAGEEDVTDNEDDEEEEPVRKKKMEAARKSKKPTKNAKGDEDDDDDDEGGAEQRLPSGKKSKGKGGKITGLQQILQDKTGKQTVNEEVEEDLDKYLEKAPASCREYITNAVRRQEEERAELIEYIMNHENNWFTKDYLEEKELAELQGIVAIADGKNKGRMNFAGAGAVSGYQSPLRNQDHDEEPLISPQIDWSAKE